MKVRTPATRVSGLQAAKIEPALDADQQAAGERRRDAQRLPIPAAFNARPALDGQAGIAFENLLRELRPLARLPQLGGVDDAIAKRARRRAARCA